MKKVKQAIVLRSFQLPGTPNSDYWPASSRIKLDDHKLIKKRLHELYTQQGGSFGQSGDRCEYLTNAQLIELETLGFIKLVY